MKRRAGHAPDESGVPVGTEYNWLIVNHQRVTRLDANSYITRIEGRKFKVANKRAGKGTWNVSEKAQRKKVLAYREQLIEQLKAAHDEVMLPWTVGPEERVYGLELRNLNELREMAGNLQIEGRSKMKREQLLTPVKEQLHGDGAHVETADITSLNQMIRDERHKLVRKAA